MSPPSFLPFQGLGREPHVGNGRKNFCRRSEDSQAVSNKRLPQADLSALKPPSGVNTLHASRLFSGTVAVGMLYDGETITLDIYLCSLHKCQNSFI